jgi:hypothetical protein
VADQLSKGDTEESEADSAVPGRAEAVKSIRDAIALVKKGYKMFYSRDHDWEQSSTVKEGTETLLQETKPTGIHSIGLKAVKFLFS